MSGHTGGPLALDRCSSLAMDLGGMRSPGGGGFLFTFVPVLYKCGPGRNTTQFN